MAHFFEGGAARRGVALMGQIRLLVLGAGGHGRSVAEAALLSGLFTVVGVWTMLYGLVKGRWAYLCWAQWPAWPNTGASLTRPS